MGFWKGKGKEAEDTQVHQNEDKQPVNEESIDMKQALEKVNQMSQFFVKMKKDKLQL